MKPEEIYPEWNETVDPEFLEKNPSAKRLLGPLQTLGLYSTPRHTPVPCCIPRAAHGTLWKLFQDPPEQRSQVAITLYQKNMSYLQYVLQSIREARHIINYWNAKQCSENRTELGKKFG
eukprot:Protomagalhaensia_wolfi_Nauph_80__3113@NODE_3183_length_863_cov_4_507282_g2491_i0_p1_GENE_NODE_3183_length_863_cov_4_507282_g2491_i0NODE_3183_length_863_cov_4_507282_g2491_i0_p1_ORF_typecomplete_len119_score10_69_NODE_3183_length_863_cov_4_507282_g2491_i0443799